MTSKPFQETKRFAIIGSGPSALACVWELIDSNIEISIFDTHITDTNLEIHPARDSSQKFKLTGGSDYPYRHFRSGPKYETNGLAIPYSFAEGGLSSVWGATMLPFSLMDIKHWPIYMQALEKEYEFISERMPIARPGFESSIYYQDYSNSEGLLPSKNIQTVLESSHSSQEDFEYSVTSLAVRVQTAFQKGCIYCNKCLEGCPYRYIWSAKADWENIRASKRVNFEDGIRVLQVHETFTGVTFTGVRQDNSEYQSEEFDRIILATGSIESFRIMAASGLTPKSTILQDSNTFLVPFFHRRHIFEDTKLGYSLSQAYLRAKSVKGFALHFQFYNFTEALLNRAISTSWIARLIPKKILANVMSRLIFAIGYLPSEYSKNLSMSLDEIGNLEILALRSNLSKRKKNSRIGNKYILNKSIFRRAGLWPISSMIQHLNAGLGSHYGGWAPAGISSDSLGRLNSDSRVHLVDSSVLPTIPAGPITFTVMANAVRIVRAIPK